MAKWSPAALAAGKVTLGAEWNFRHGRSLNFLAGIPIPVTHRVDYDGTASDISIKGTSFLLGYRNYLGKKPYAGLYLEPYAKYVSASASGLLEGRLMNEKSSFDTKTEHSAWGLGLQLGYQFVISDRFIIDFYFLGPEANIVDFNTLSKDVSSTLPWSPQQSQEAERDIREIIEDIPIIGKRTTIEVRDSQKEVEVNYNGFLPSVRFGLSLGWRF